MSDAVDPAVSPAVEAEAYRQHQLIMRGTRYGDDQTRQTMAREMYERLVDSLTDDRPLRVYLGVDPTSPDLHIGHCVALRKLQLFQQLGHQAILLIGDFTGLVGDPSDKDSARPMQAAEILARNARTYREQAFKLLDPSRTEVLNNSEWLAGMSFADVIHLAANFTVQQFAERDTFAKRLDARQPVYLHEFMYGLMQGYDAVALEADVQLGGTDQTFNIGAGRILQPRYEQRPQVAVLTPILVGTDGVQRMSKSTGNYIGIDEPPDAQYGKAMSIPDQAIAEFFIHGTNVDAAEADQIIADAEAGTLPSMDAKRRLAHAIVSEWHDESAADAAAAEWTPRRLATQRSRRHPHPRDRLRRRRHRHSRAPGADRRRRRGPIPRRRQTPPPAGRNPAQRRAHRTAAAGAPRRRHPQARPPSLAPHPTPLSPASC